MEVRRENMSREMVLFNKNTFTMDWVSAETIVNLVKNKK